MTLYFLYISILNYVFNVLLNVYYEFKENIVKISLKRILIIQKKWKKRVHPIFTLVDFVAFSSSRIIMQSAPMRI